MKDNHNYEKPEPGTTNWHLPINENFDRLDSDVEVRDVEANLGQYTPKEGAKFFATDTACTFIADGDRWAYVQSTGPDPTFSSVRAKNLNGTAYAREFDGEGLASKVENALKWLQEVTNGQGRVRVTPNSGGDPWVWDKDLTIDPTEWRGVTIDVDPGVRIEYPGSGWALTLASTWANQNGNFDVVSEITGGTWLATGEAKGWLRIQDSYRTLVMPRNVEFQNSSNDAVGVAVENHDGWSESTQIDSARFYCDICVDFRPSNVTGGSGSSSFHGTVVKNCKFEVKNIGVCARGGIDYSTVDSNSFFVKGKGATLLQIGGSDTSVKPSLDGTTISNNKFEDPGGDTSDDVAIRLGSNYFDFKQPTFLNNKIFLSSTGVKVQNDASARCLLQFRITENKFIFEDLLGDSSIGFYYDELRDEFEASAAVWKNDSHGKVPVRSSPPSPHEEGGTFWIDDGSNTPAGNPGLAFLDEDGTPWYIEAQK